MSGSETEISWKEVSKYLYPTKPTAKSKSKPILLPKRMESDWKRNSKLYGEPMLWCRASGLSVCTRKSGHNKHITALWREFSHNLDTSVYIICPTFSLLIEFPWKKIAFYFLMNVLSCTCNVYFTLSLSIKLTCFIWLEWASTIFLSASVLISIAFL